MGNLTRDDVRAFLLEQIAELNGVAVGDIPDEDVTFTDLGLSSLQAVELTDKLERWSGRELPATLAYDYPSIEVASEYVSSLPESTGSGR